MGGLIPAHAGKTLTNQGSPHHAKAHPRSRGENRRPLVRPERRSGSSPLTRGKRWRERTDETAARLIPAHAGKTRIYTEGRDIPGAHPRSRGENMAFFSVTSRRRGSSPLTRGKHLRRSDRRDRRRLIPAHAGKTSDLSESTLMFRAHPRSRGENAHIFSDYQDLTGSSPLTRGKHGLE